MTHTGIPMIPFLRKAFKRNGTHPPDTSPRRPNLQQVESLPGYVKLLQNLEQGQYGSYSHTFKTKHQAC